MSAKKRGSIKVADYPDVAKQWHPTKNGNLTPEDVSFGSKILVWWKCDVADDHEWLASPKRRIGKGAGCRSCSGYQASATNSLASLFPEVAEYWHPTKNQGKSPARVVATTEKEYWWKCDQAPDHEWKAAPAAVIKAKTTCPFCSGKRVCYSNSLAALYPDVAAEWHPTKNKKLQPGDVRPGSKTKAWWKCDAGPDHEWQAQVADRTGKSSGCPCCSGRRASVTNSLAPHFPDVAVEWHPTKNKKTPADYPAKSNAKVWWKCPVADDHEWQATISNRTHNHSGCPCCAGKKPSVTNSLGDAYPEIAAEWHPTKNQEQDLSKVLSGTDKKVWWRCSVDPTHEWRATIKARTKQGSGCLACAGKQVSATNSLQARAPDVAKQWHPTKNKKLTPKDIVAGSNKKVWWKCPEGPDHEWQAPVVSRALGGIGCPYCRGLKPSVTNSLASLHPELAKQWHPKRNGKLTPAKITAGSNKVVWWKCPEGADHEWRATVNNRTNPHNQSGCPCCAGKQLSEDNSLARLFPEIALQWHPTKNGTLRADQVLAGTHDKAWWKCSKAGDHEWEASVHSRTGRNLGCPCCANKKLSVTNSLATINPDAAAEWHPQRNGQVKPEDVIAGNDQKYWWRCSSPYVSPGGEETGLSCS